MFPSNAPYRGPSKSLHITNHRLGTARDLRLLDEQISAMPNIVDPQDTTIVLPTLSPTLAIGYSSGQFVYHNQIAYVASQSFTLPPQADVYADVGPVGTGVPGDWNTSAGLTYQPSGTYAGAYLSSSTVLTSQAALDLTVSSNLTLTFNMTNLGGGGYGPALFDGNGNGYIVYYCAGISGLYRATNYLKTGSPLVTFVSNSPLSLTNAPLDSMHQYVMTISYLDSGAISIAATVDNASSFNTFVDYTPSALLQNLFPALMQDVGSILIRSWGWSCNNGYPCLGWINTAYPQGTPIPPTTAGAKHFFVVTTNTSNTIAIQWLFDRHLLSSRLRSIKDTISQLKAAYN